jgi:hypothetical protein
MDRKSLRMIPFIALALSSVIGGELPSQSPDTKTAYPKMAPLEQYQMPRDLTILTSGIPSCGHRCASTRPPRDSQQFTNESVGHWLPHLMFLVPLTEAVSWGAGAQGSPVVGAFIDVPERFSLFLAPVAK